MSAKNLAVILLKCFGIWLIATAVLRLPAAFEALRWVGDDSSGMSSRHIFLLQAAVALVYAALGLLFLFNTNLVVQRLFRDLEEPTQPAPTPFSYQAIGFSLLGVWALSGGIPDLVSRAVVLATIYGAKGQPEMSPWLISTKTQLLDGAVRTVIGAILFFGSRKIASAWFRLQPIRQAKPRDERPAS